MTPVLAALKPPRTTSWPTMYSIQHNLRRPFATMANFAKSKETTCTQQSTNKIS
jgi:hypothetical protein